MDSKAADFDSETNRFYCSVKGCVFSKGMGKWFKRKMLVDQHFLNSHSEKKHICPKCSKPYSIDWQLKHHLKTCGLEWKCLSCDKVYKERLSLLTHCKRHSHILPENAKIRKSKESNGQMNTISLNVIVMPVIINAPPLLETTAINPRPILPKPILLENDVKDVSIQTEKHKQCKCRNINTGPSVEGFPSKSFIGKAQIATQTEKSGNKVRASHSAQCPPLRVKQRKGKDVHNCESTETQTFESVLSFTNAQQLLTVSKSTSTTPPVSKKSKTSVAVETNFDADYCDLANESDSSAFIKSSNPLLSQLNIDSCCASPVLSTPLSSITKELTSSNISEQSVQTDDKYLLDFSNIETQTTDEFLNDAEFLGLDVNDDTFFTDLELNDIETQTIWNSDEMTQTD